MIDCLIIGINNPEIKPNDSLSIGKDFGDYKENRLGYFNYDNKPYTAINALNTFIFNFHSCLTANSIILNNY